MKTKKRARKLNMIFKSTTHFFRISFLPLYHRTWNQLTYLIRFSCNHAFIIVGEFWKNVVPFIKDVTPKWISSDLPINRHYIESRPVRRSKKDQRRRKSADIKSKFDGGGALFSNFFDWRRFGAKIRKL